jgi:hypothetical protein
MDKQESSVPETPQKEPKHIICLSVSAGLTPVLGSTITNCVECDDRLWIAPASDSLAGYDLKPLCFGCADKKAKADNEPIEVHPPTPEQIEELKQELERRKLI